MVHAFLGYDPREHTAYRVAERSILQHELAGVYPILLPSLQGREWYTRPTETRDGKLWDVVSGAPMSTEHAIARFFTPFCATYRGLHGWAVSADCDILVRRPLSQLLRLADPAYALMVVPHDHRPAEAVKMDGQVQTAYRRKNWSSVILWNLDHPAHQALTLRVLNTWPGRDLHAFAWLPDHLIGFLPPTWNYLVGVTTGVPPDDVCLAHFTLGTPDMDGYAESLFADEWRALADRIYA